MKRKTLSFLLLLSLLLAGCRSGNPEKPADSPNGKGEPQAMGRYIENELALPETIISVRGFHQNKDSSLSLLCYAVAGEKQTMKLYRMADGSSSWKDETPSWLKKLVQSDTNFTDLSPGWDKEDNLYLTYTKTPPGAKEPISCLARIDGDGKRKELFTDITLYENQSMSDGRAFAVADNGDFLFCSRFSLFQLDGRTGKVKFKYFPKYGEVFISFLAVEDTLHLCDGDHILSFDLNNSRLEEDFTPKDTSVFYGEHNYYTTSGISEASRILAGNTDGEVYFADKNGIFRYIPGNAMLEKIADGSLNSLGTPAFSLSDFFITQDAFFVLGYTEDRYTLRSYTYSPDIPTVPATELTVYSLYENMTIRQAIGIFQMQNPQIHVTYQTGIAGSNGVTLSDALRALSTELLAKKGPDVLILDGLPAGAYREKGVLADLSDIYTEKTASGELLENIAAAYRQEDGTVSAIPGRFEAPMMLGEPDAVQSIQSLADMAGWLAENEDAYEHPLVCTDPEVMMDQFFPLCLPDIKQPDGSLSREKLTSFLSELKKITDMKTSAYTYGTYDESDARYLFQFDALNWLKNGTALCIGSIRSIEQTFSSHTVLKEKKGDFVPLLNRNLFVPKTVLAVNSGSTNQDNAKAFIRCVLSDAVQKYDLEDGLPVTSITYENSIQSISSSGQHSYYGTGFNDRKGQEVSADLVIYWPPKDFLNHFLDTLKALKPAPDTDQSILPILKEESAEYFKGKAGLEDTMDTIMHKLNLSMKE